MRPSCAILIFTSFISCAVLIPEEEFACTGTRGCICSSSIGHYELCCHCEAENSIVSTIRPYSYVQVQCMPETTPSGYDAVTGLRVGPVQDADFRHCPPPDEPFSGLLSLFGITSVTTFRFQSHRNLSGNFETRRLTGLANVTKLLLMSNNLTHLPEDFLQDVPKLTWLDLKENNLKLPEKFFNPIPDLQVLELGDNKLTHLNPPLLSNLKKLRLLNLWKNRLMNITRNVFSGLSSLEQLDISSNSIISVPSDVFHDLENLVQLSLYSNNFTHLPPGLLSGNKNLEIFRLHDNHQTLKLAEGTLGSLPKLNEVYLMRNNITSLPENLFWGSDAIVKIYLQGNSLRNFPKLVFRDQKNLEILDLSENHIEYLAPNAFSRLHKLQSLKLGYNKIRRIEGEMLFGLYSLASLDMEHNELQFMDSSSLTGLTELKIARFSHNQLSFLPEESSHGTGFDDRDSFGRTSPLRNCLYLEYLYLANNSITEIFSDWRVTLIRLRTLDLSYNKIESFATVDTNFLGQNLTVDLRHNNISGIDLSKLETVAVIQNKDGIQPAKNIRLLLEENPLICDCKAYDLFRYFEHKLVPAVYAFVTLERGNLKCSQPAHFSNLSVEDVESKDLTCRLDSKYECPASCNCLFRQYDSGLVVNCSYSGLTEIPRMLPTVQTANHTELILDGNYIDKLPNSTYDGYENVTELHLSSNNISNIGIGMLTKNLQVLTLDDNNLTTLSSSTIKFLSESRDIRHLTLHNNPWKCDCSARELLDLIQQKFKEIPFLGNVTCSEGNKPLSKMSVSDLCPVSVDVIVSCIAAAVFGLLVGTLAALYYKYQREVKVWLYSHRFCLWFVTEEELDRDKLYDAFVSYSHKDENFVVNTLVPELESGENPFKLCLHYRDWMAGEWIPNQIARSVENSRRTLVVLSPNFLESEWSRMEFRAAHKQALSEGRARVIVVLYGDVGPTEDLDPELRAYISMNTYVKWGDPWFWEKLKYALPHPPSLVRTNLNFLRKRTVKKEKNRIDDKLELIHTLDLSSSPHGDVTPPIDGTPNGNVTHDK